MLPAATAQHAADQIETIIQHVSQIILGKEDVVRLAVTCLLARGHLLFEDQPGVGKTMLSQSLAQALGLGFRRVQFTSDLLPAEAAGEPPSPLAQLRWILRDAHHPLRAAVLRDPLAPHIK